LPLPELAEALRRVADFVDGRHQHNIEDEAKKAATDAEIKRLQERLELLEGGDVPF